MKVSSRTLLCDAAIFGYQYWTGVDTLGEAAGAMTQFGENTKIRNTSEVSMSYWKNIWREGHQLVSNEYGRIFISHDPTLRSLKKS